MRRAARVDSNHVEIRNAFRKFGCWVADIHDIGKGLPDLLIAVPPAWSLALIEIKDGSKPPSQRKLTEQESKLHETCPAMIWIVTSLDDVQTVVHFYRAG